MNSVSKSTATSSAIDDDFVFLAINDGSIASLWKKMKAAFLARSGGQEGELQAALEALERCCKDPKELSAKRHDLELAKTICLHFSVPLERPQTPLQPQPGYLSRLWPASQQAQAPNLPQRLFCGLESLYDALDDVPRYCQAQEHLLMLLGSHSLQQTEAEVELVSLQLIVRHLFKRPPQNVPEDRIPYLMKLILHFIERRQLFLLKECACLVDCYPAAPFLIFELLLDRDGQLSGVSLSEAKRELFSALLPQMLHMKEARDVLSHILDHILPEWAEDCLMGFLLHCTAGPVQHIMQPILQRIDQLGGVLLTLGLLHKLVVFERALESTQKVYHKKGVLPNKLDRTAYINPALGLFSLCKGKDGRMNRSSMHKRITEAIFYPVDCTRLPFFVVHSVNLKAGGEEGITLARHEIKIAAIVRGLPHIVQLIDYHERDTVDGKRINALWERYEPQNLQDLLNMKVQFTPEEQKDLAHQLMTALKGFHSARCVHGDVKTENIVYRLLPTANRQMRRYFALCDLGFSLHESEFQKRGTFTKVGVYGTFLHTAPEALGDETFTGDYFKAEMWALGILLYRLYFGEYPFWQTQVKACIETPWDLQLRRNLKNAIERYRAQWKGGQDPYSEFIFSLLDINPATRPSLNAAQAALKKV